jgi:hypothetical protein
MIGIQYWIRNLESAPLVALAAMAVANLRISTFSKCHNILGLSQVDVAVGIINLIGTLLHSSIYVTV